MTFTFSVDINTLLERSGFEKHQNNTENENQRMDLSSFSTNYDVPRDTWRSLPMRQNLDMPRDPIPEAMGRDTSGMSPYSGSYINLHLDQQDQESYRQPAGVKNEREQPHGSNEGVMAGSFYSLKYNTNQEPTSHPDSASSSPCPAPNLQPHSDEYIATQTSHFAHYGSTQDPASQYSLPPYPPSTHYTDSHVTTNISPSHAGLFPSMNVNVSMNMNVHGVPTPLPPSFYEPHTDPWSTRIGPHQTSFYTSPVGGGEYLGHGSHSAYSSYSSMPHTYAPIYDTETPRLGPSVDRESLYKTNTGDSVSRLYSLGAMNTRRHSGRLASPYDVTGKVNLCRICGKTYARPSTLKTHLRTHSGEKPYKCSTCSKSFSQAANLTAHIRTHSGEKPFRCPLCERRFSQSSSVTTHMRTHSGERPYRCRLCKKAFSDSSTLTKHLRIHSGEKPYQCKLCLLRFSQSGNLNRHMRVHAAQAH